MQNDGNAEAFAEAAASATTQGGDAEAIAEGIAESTGTRARFCWQLFDEVLQEETPMKLKENWNRGMPLLWRPPFQKEDKFS